MWEREFYTRLYAQEKRNKKMTAQKWQQKRLYRKKLYRDTFPINKFCNLTIVTTVCFLYVIRIENPHLLNYRNKEVNL